MPSEPECAPHRLPRAVYERAESYLPWNVAKLIFNTSIQPNWIEGTDGFWYKRSTRHGTEFVLIDAASGARQPLFDHQRLAAELSQASGHFVTFNQLPFDELTVGEQGDVLHIEFVFDGSTWTCDLDNYACTRGEAPEVKNPAEVRSPDGRWVAFLRRGDVFVRACETGSERQLTDDAESHYSYGALPEGRQSAITDKLLGRVLKPGIAWSPDSTRLLTYKLDERNIKEMYLLQSATPDDDVRPVLHSYKYPLPGDEYVEEAALLTIDVATGKATPAQMEPLVSVLHNPLELNLVQWGKDGQSYYAIQGSRDRRQVELLRVDAETGEAQTLHEERGSTPVYPGHIPVESKVTCVREICDGDAVTWFSSRSGWGHLYLLDAQTGEERCQLTSGAWNVRDIVQVDEAGRWIYFTANGREADRDPYYRHLYRCSFDGSQFELLTPEDADHDIAFSPSGAYFIDTFSRIDQPQTIVLRSADGRLVSELEQADISGLLGRGWRFPERFQVKARDGVTDIYGMIIRPSDYDPMRKYPVLDAIYPGPQVIRTPKAFPTAANQYWQDQALAELGFIVITIDGFGTPYRSRQFIDVATGAGFGEAGGLEDHVAGIKQLGERDRSLDLERVGIYGHSGGGYASTRAMLLFPDFYKAAVSSAGNHDNLDYVALWAEAWIGLYDRETYTHQDNVRLAANLKGKLLLAHGEMDDNVHPSETLRLVDALIAANKDFEMLIIPHTNHGIFDLRRGLAAFDSDYARGHPYFTRKRWDFFVRHLVGAEPPEGFGIARPGE
jgi:dipeptidyl aminopeptidase/acylaminoacyl peptidase